jgi:hypothetical protein
MPGYGHGFGRADDLGRSGHDATVTQKRDFGWAFDNDADCIFASYGVRGFGERTHSRK